MKQQLIDFYRNYVLSDLDLYDYARQHELSYMLCKYLIFFGKGLSKDEKVL